MLFKRKANRVNEKPRQQAQTRRRKTRRKQEQEAYYTLVASMGQVLQHIGR